MAKISVLFPLLFLSVFAFGQRKIEFGFVVQAGTFTLPYKQETEIGQTFIYPAGFSGSYGLFVSSRLGDHFRLSMDVRYNFSMYEEHGSGPDLLSSHFPAPMQKTAKTFNVHSLLMPLQIQYSTKKEGKMSLTAGISPHCVTGSEIHREYEGSYALPVIPRDRVQKVGGGTLFQVFFTAGAYYKIEPKTSMGIEFMGSLRRKQPSAFNSWREASDFGGSLFWMQSFAISMRHNILR